MSIPSNDIINAIVDKKFRRIGQNGYSDTEVDNFLDDICDAVEELEAKMETLRQQALNAQAAQKTLELKLQASEENLEKARAEVEKAKQVRNYAAPTPVAPVVPVAPAAPVSEEGTIAAMELLKAAQKVKEEIVVSAKEQADKMLADAQQRAQALHAEITSLENAKLELRRTLQETMQQVAGVLDSTEG